MADSIEDRLSALRATAPVGSPLYTAPGAIVPVQRSALPPAAPNPANAALVRGPAPGALDLSAWQPAPNTGGLDLSAWRSIPDNADIDPAGPATIGPDGKVTGGWLDTPAALSTLLKDPITPRQALGEARTSFRQARTTLADIERRLAAESARLGVTPADVQRMRDETNATVPPGTMVPEFDPMGRFGELEELEGQRRMTQAEVDRLRNVVVTGRGLATQTGFSSAVNSGFNALLSAPGDFVRAAGELGDAIQFFITRDTNENDIVAAGRAMQSVIDEAFAGDPARQEEFFGQVVTGLGSFAGVWLGGIAGRAAGSVVNATRAGGIVGGATVGAAQQGVAMVDDAMNAGVRIFNDDGTPRDEEAIRQARGLARYQAFLAGLAIGGTEVIPISRMFDRLDAPSQAAMRRFFESASTQAGEEAIQEFTQSVLQDVAAQRIYDPNRPIDWQAAFNNAGIGAIVGGAVGGIGAALTTPPREGGLTNNEQVGVEAGIETAIEAGAPPTAPPGAPGTQAGGPSPVGPSGVPAAPTPVGGVGPAASPAPTTPAAPAAVPPVASATVPPAGAQPARPLPIAGDSLPAANAAPSVAPAGVGAGLAPSPAAVANPPSPIEVGTLIAAGYLPDYIADMDPAERAEAMTQAIEQGVPQQTASPEQMTAFAPAQQPVAEPAVVEPPIEPPALDLSSWTPATPEAPNVAVSNDGSSAPAAGDVGTGSAPDAGSLPAGSPPAGGGRPEAGRSPLPQGAKAAGLGAAPRVTTPARPDNRVTDLLTFIAMNGGVRSTPELRTINAHVAFVPGRGRFVGPRGLDVDRMRELVAEAGYFGGDTTAAIARTTPADLYDLIDRALRGNLVAPDTADDQAAVARKGSAAREAAYADRVETEILAWMQAEGVDDPAWLKRATEVAITSGVEADLTDEKITEIMERAAISLIPPDKRKVVADDIPFDPHPDDLRPRDAAPSGGEAVRGGGQGEPSPVPSPGEPQGQAGEGRPAAVDQTSAGDQLVIPGAEQITGAQHAQLLADKPLRPAVDQKPADDGLFGDSAAQMDLVDMARKPEAPAPVDMVALRSYAQGVVGPDVRSVTLVGSSAAGATGRDIDMLYDLGTRPMTAEEIEALVERQPTIDLEKYDSFFKAGDRYFHLSTGAGNAIVENTEYAEQQAGKPKVVLAEAPAPQAEATPVEGKRLAAEGPWDFENTYPDIDRAQYERLLNERPDPFDAAGEPSPEQITEMIDAILWDLQGRHTAILRTQEAITKAKPADKKAMETKVAGLFEGIKGLGEEMRGIWSGDAVNAILGTGRKRATAEWKGAAPKPAEEKKPAAKPEPAPKAEEPAAAPEPSPEVKQPPSRERPAIFYPSNEETPLVQRLLGEGFKTIVSARTFARQNDERAKEAKDEKHLDEIIEAAVVSAARRIVREGGGDQAAIYKRLVQLYDNQPKLAVRTAKSMGDQAYSTPVPLAYLASRLAGVEGAQNLYEPTAGNGALLVEDLKMVAFVNEIDETRRKNLREGLGYNSIGQDATEAQTTEYAVRHSRAPKVRKLEGNASRVPFDVVLMNPPFGSVREDGGSKEWTVVGDYRTAQIDHAIALNALQALKDDGKAVLIVGGVNPQNDRQEGYRASSKRKFYARLYKDYNVVDHFTVAGPLYARQGAGWPVDVIVIHGRGASARALPAADVPALFTSWDDLAAKLPGANQQQTAKPATTQEPAAAAAPTPAPVAAPDDFDSAFDSALDDAFGKAAPKKAPVALTPEREAAWQKKAAAVNAAPAAPKAESPADAMRDLAKFFNDPTNFGVGIGAGFDPAIYAKIKPMLVKAAAAFKHLAGDATALVKAMVAELRDAYQMTREAVERIRPYMRRFMDDLTSGAVTLEAEPTSAPVAAAPVQPKARAPRSEAAANDAGQVPYAPYAARGMALDTLQPANLRQGTEDALKGLEARVGDLDAFVGAELGYQVDAEGMFFMRDGKKERPFSAEQVDALALAIDNAKKGASLVLGDQTGIGKGRVGAGMLRWAKRQGYIPVFFTEKPDLFGDMYRDLTDIGADKIDYYMTNVGASIPLNDAALEWTIERDEAKAAGEPRPKRPAEAKWFSSSSDKGKVAAEGRAVIDGKRTPDVVFTTYDQVNDNARGDGTQRRQFFEAIGPRAFFVLDEAHNAGGQEAGTWKPKPDKDGKVPPEPRAQWMRGVLRSVKAGLYMSATYAKRPDTMTLYNRTDMPKAVDKAGDLPELISRGGVPLQQIVAGMLGRAGQYLRRERSFAGINYTPEVVPVSEEAYRDFTDAIGAIYRFDRAVAPDRESYGQAVLDRTGAAKARDGSIGDAAADSTEFAAIMHNIVNQMLLSITSDAVATKAIEALREGRKPVIGLSNTMESFLVDYVTENGLAVGSEVGISFKDVMRRYLSRTLRITIKNADDEKSYIQIPVTDLVPELQAQYRAVEEILESAAISEFPVSPIDHIRGRLTKMGYSVAEVTGRQMMLDYAGNVPVLMDRPQREVGPAGKRSSISAFNNGKLDVLILNKSGSTGVSAHASPKVGKDTRPRRMIIAQADPNIDVYMQMLGRVNRTGQINLPDYIQAVPDVPAAMRPMAVLMKKMASLNANTTGARSGTFSANDVDIMNKYGDIVATQVMIDAPDWNERMGDPVAFDDKGKPVTEEPLRRVMGRMTLIRPDEQADLLDQLQSSYKALIERLEAAGENALEAKTLDLKAITKETVVVREAKGTSPFEGEVRVERLSVVSPGRSMAPDEVLAAAADGAGVLVQNLRGGTDAAKLDYLPQQARYGFDQKIDAALQGGASWAKADAQRASKEKRSAVEKRHEANAKRFRLTTSYMTPGTRVSLKISDDANPIYGIVLRVERQGKTKNPLALSSWTAVIAVPDSQRMLAVPLSQLYPPGTPKGDEVGFDLSHPDYTVGAQQIVDMFEAARKEGREDRVMVTGNILSGYDESRTRGQIVNFTMEDGTERPGILMPRGYTVKQFLAARAIRFPTGAAIREFLRNAPEGAMVESQDGYITIIKSEGSFFVSFDGTKSKGGRYFLDKGIGAAVGGASRIVKGAGKASGMNVFVSGAQLDAMVPLAQKAGASFLTTEHQAIAEAATNGSGADGRGKGPRSVASGLRRILPGRRSDLGHLANDIQALIGRMAGPKVKVKFADQIAATDSIAGSAEMERARAEAGVSQELTIGGSYKPNLTIPAEALIEVALSDPDYDPKASATHEIWHHIEFALLTEEELQLIRRDLASPNSTLIAMVAQANNISYAAAAAMPSYEITANAFQIYVERKEKGQPLRGFHIGLRRAFERLLELFRAIKRTLGRRGVLRVEDIFETARVGAMRGRTTRQDGALDVEATEEAYRAGRGEAASSLFEDPLASSLPSRPLESYWQQRTGGLLARARRSFTRDTADAIRVKAQDSFLKWKRIEQAIEADTGAKIGGGMQAYLTQSLFSGRAGERLDDLRRKHIEPLVEAMRKAEVDPRSLGIYLYARHAFERNAEISKINPGYRDKSGDWAGAVDPTTGEPNGSGMTDREAQAILDAIGAKLPTYEALADQVYAIRDWSLDIMVRFGLLSREQADEWTSKYPDYVPLRGHETNDGDSADRPRAGRGFDIRGKESFRALGRQSIADNPLAYVIMQAQQAIVRSEKNRVLRTVLNLINANPNDAIWKVVKSVPERYVDEETGLVRTRFVPPPGWSEANRDAFHGVKIGGKVTWIEFKGDIGAGLSRALRGVGREQSAIVQAMMKLSRVWAMLQTTLNPEFVFTNFLRDTPAAVINVTDVDGKPLGTRRKILTDALTLKSIRGIRRAMKGKANAGEVGRYYEEFRAAGGKISFIELNDVDRIKARIDAAFSAGKLRRGVWAIGDWIDGVNTAVENSARLSVYIALRKANFSKDAAASVARELTVNFNRKGEWGPVLNSLYIFYNASTQGTFRMASAIAKSKKVRRVVYGIVAYGFLSEFLNAFLDGDDDEYDKIPDYVKERNMILMLGPGGARITIPMPYGYNVFYLAGQQLAAMVRGVRTPSEVVGSTLLAALDAFNPIGTAPTLGQFLSPTLLDPVVQISENRTWYGGNVAPTKFDQSKPDSQNFWTDTPEGYVDIARVLNEATGGTVGRAGWVDISPETVEHIVDFGIGGAGRFIADTVNGIRSLIEGEEIAADDIPIARRLIAFPTASSSRHAFWEAWDVIDQAHYETNEYRRQGMAEQFNAATEAYARELAVWRTFDRTRQAMNDIREAITLTERDRSLSGAERAERIERFETQERELIEAAIQAYEGAAN